MTEKTNPAVLAITAVGSVRELSRRLGLTRQCIEYWRKEGRIPMSRIPQVSQVTGVPKALLDPEFRPEAKKAL